MDHHRKGSLYAEELRTLNYGPHFYAYYYKQWESYRMPYHEHDSTEIMYIISGVCRVDVRHKDGRVEQVSLKKGQFIMLDAGIPHRLIVEADASCRILNVEFGFAPVLPGQPSVRQLTHEEDDVASLLDGASPYLVLPDQDEVYHIMKSLVLELDQRGLTAQKKNSSISMPDKSQSTPLPALEHHSFITLVNSDVPLRDSVVAPLTSSPQHSLESSQVRERHRIPSHEQGIIVLTLFIQLLVRIARLYKEKTRITQDQTELYIKRCIEFMYQNMDRNIQMKSISSAVNLHPSYLYRIFRKSTGMTPSSYLTMLRMEKAKKLLMNTDIPVSEMSDYVGVSSRQYFHSLFRKYTGLTPVEYRNSMDREGHQYPTQQDISSVRGPDNNIDF